MIQTRRSVRA